MDGCANVGGCIEAPFAILEICKDPKGALLFFTVVGLIAVPLAVFQPAPTPPPPPKPPLMQRIGRKVEEKVGHPINKLKIKLAEQNRHQEQEATTAPVDSSNPRLRDRIKDWMRNQLNEDYDKRHPEQENPGK